MDKQELQQKLKQLEAAYQNFLQELGNIRKEQDDILGDYSRRLDALRVEKLEHNI